MARILALFGGQGSQYPGMGKELYHAFPRAKEIYTCAGDIFGYDVAKTSFEGTMEELTATQVAQTALFTLQVAAYEAAKGVMGEAEAVAGHSLGEYAALVCAGACSLEDGMRLIKVRAAAMQKAAAGTKGAMAAIIGKDAATVEALCKQAGGQVWPVNYNTPTQTVIAGEKSAVDNAAALFAEQGAKAVPLDVAGAFHTPLMEPAALELKAAAEKCAFSPTKLAFYSNYSGGRLEIGDYPEYLMRHMLGPVRFVEEMAAAAADGMEAVVEFGPKRAIAMAKKNHKAFQAFHIEDAATLTKTAAALSAV